jgi:ribosomal-protein-alanine N-acetyltransferase
MTLALKQLVSMAKTDFRLNRLQATVVPKNIASKKVLENAGFLNEGLLRQYEFWEGKGFVDLELYGKIL